jgi:hypothetical protein
VTYVVAGALGVAIGLVSLRFFRRFLSRIPRWIVAIEFENPYVGDSDHGTMRHLFFIRGDKSLRGDELYARRFWTEKGALHAAAEWKLTDHLSEDTTLRLIQVRIVRVGGL